MMSTYMLFLWLACVSLVVDFAVAEEKSDRFPLSRKIDENIYFAAIHPFADEWNKLINQSRLAPAPVNFWLRCIDRKVRGYLFIEHLHHLDHDKEAYMPSVSVINKEIKVLADNSPIEMRPWLGGVDFYFDIPATAPNSHWVDLTIPGFKHFTRFPVSMCMPSPSPSPPSSALALTSSPPSPSSSITLTSPETSYTHTRKYIMHVHLNDHKDRGDINPVVVRGVANHIAYHMCTLSLDNYEVVIQEPQLEKFLADERIAAYAKQGKVTFIIRNPGNPEPILMSPHRKIDCYWQQYTENLALLRHWQEDVRMFFMDSDEFIVFNENLTKQTYYEFLNSNSALGFVRFMAFHDKVQSKPFPPKLIKPTVSNVVNHGDHHHGDIHDFSFTHKDYITITDRLRDPKLVVNPSRVGCYIVHWAGCGDPTKELNVNDFGKILHFENLYRNRWPRPNIESMKNARFVPTNNTLVCDPVLLAPGSSVTYWG